MCVDIEGFSGEDRTDAQRVVAHQGMYQAVQAALAACGLSLEDCHHEDRGDGMLVIAPAETAKDRLVALLPSVLAGRLAEHNHIHAAGARIRLRVAVHAGEVQHDRHGMVGEAVNFTFRLLDADAVKHALAGGSGMLAVVASERIFDEVIRHTPASAPGAYRRVRVRVKETATFAWLRVPDETVSPDDGEIGPWTSSGSAEVSAGQELSPGESAVDVQQRHGSSQVFRVVGDQNIIASGPGAAAYGAMGGDVIHHDYGGVPQPGSPAVPPPADHDDSDGPR